MRKVQQINWMRAALAAVAFFVASGAPLNAQTAWKLVWSDEFDGPAGAPPAPANWRFETGPGRVVGGNQEAETYCAYGDAQPPCQASVPNAYLDGHGHLVIVAIRTAGTVDVPEQHRQVPLYTSARLVSRQEFRYGRIEASLRVPTGMGVWPAFWALGHQSAERHWPQTGEIDIMESWNPQPGTTIVDATLNHGSVHGPARPASAEGYVDVTGNYHFPQPMQQGFHQFAVEWEPGAVDFYCDGILYSRQSVADLSGQQQWALDHEPFALLLNLAMGGGFFGYPDQTTPQTPALIADYVRVYQRDESLLPSGWGSADIGGPAHAGHAQMQQGIWTVAGSGDGIAGHADQFNFAYHGLHGDGELIAHLLDQTSTVPQARAGLMFRDSRAAGAVFALLSISPDGSVHFRVRGVANDLPGDTLAAASSARWLRLTRQADHVTAWTSADGKSWTSVGQAQMALPVDLMAGLASTARDNGAPNAARFDYVSLTPSDAAWDGLAVSLPGTVQAERFNVGGPGYSWAATMKHDSAQAMRRDEGPSIRAINVQDAASMTPGGFYLADLRKDNYLNYAVNILADGTYVIRVRVSAAAAGGSVHFNLDQKPVTASIAIPQTGGAENWRIVQSGPIHLAAGAHTLALAVDSVSPQGVAGNVDFFTVLKP